MAFLSASSGVATWWRRRARHAKHPGIESALRWMRTVVLPDDLIYLDVPAGEGVRGFGRFPFPSFPSSRPLPVDAPERMDQVRFVVIARDRQGEPLDLRRTTPLVPGLPLSGFRAVVSMRDIVVLERDAPHPRHRPLRLGLDLDEGGWLLARARLEATRVLTKDAPDAPTMREPPPPPRLSSQRATAALSIWTRGRIRGSVITAPSSISRAMQMGMRWACRDDRFPRLTAEDLEESLLQVGFVHEPAIVVSRQEIETEDAYPDKAIWVSDGTRSGAYMPEIHNVAPEQRFERLVSRLAHDKAGMGRRTSSGKTSDDARALDLGPKVVVTARAVSEVIERRGQKGVLLLEGPVVAPVRGDTNRGGLEAGRLAVSWLATVQVDDGALPSFVRPSTGAGVERHAPRMAATAEALIAFAESAGDDQAALIAKRVLAHLDRAKAEGSQPPDLALLTVAYRGKAAARLGDEAELRRAVKEVFARLDGADAGPLPLSQALSLLALASPRIPEAATRADALERVLAGRFTRAQSSGAALSLAEWAELAAVRTDTPSAPSGDVARWLAGLQLHSGAFPNTTASDFVYSRGTGKVFEVLAARKRDHAENVDAALAWLISMQYTADSAYCIPDEHKPRLIGGLRHDYFHMDAWIDGAAHLLLGVARLISR
jgi:AMMECR1